MLREYPPDMPWITVRLKNQAFAMPSDDVREMIQLGEVFAVPQVPEYVRGVINLRGSIIPLIDLRTRMVAADGLSPSGKFHIDLALADGGSAIRGGAAGKENGNQQKYSHH